MKYFTNKPFNKATLGSIKIDLKNLYGTLYIFQILFMRNLTSHTVYKVSLNYSK